MLIYFFFTSLVRILIPVHGQAASVAFNVIIIYNLIRIMVGKGILKIKNKQMPLWLILFATVILLFFVIKSIAVFRKPFNLVQNGTFETNTEGWRAYQVTLNNVNNGKRGRGLQITTLENATGYAYIIIPTKVGELYRLTVYFKKGNAEHGQIKVGNAIDDISLYYSGVLSNTRWIQYSSTFYATIPLTYITLVNLTSHRGETCFFDEISVTPF
jgi:hypothetical protein